MYTGYLLTETSRKLVLDKFPPKYDNVLCHHITEKFGVPSDSPPPALPGKVQIVGYIDSGDGVEGLLVSINGSTERPDGQKYHITLSLANGKKPVETNNYVDEAKKIAPFSVMVIPKTFTGQTPKTTKQQ
jgi:hypothetical protein